MAAGAADPSSAAPCAAAAGGLIALFVVLALSLLRVNVRNMNAEWCSARGGDASREVGLARWCFSVGPVAFARSSRAAHQSEEVYSRVRYGVERRSGME